MITPTGANTKSAIQAEMGPNVGRILAGVFIPKKLFTFFRTALFSPVKLEWYHSGRAFALPEIGCCCFRPPIFICSRAYSSRFGPLLFQFFPDTGPHLLTLACKGWRHEHLTFLPVSFRRCHQNFGLLTEKILNLAVAMPVGNTIDERCEIIRSIEIV